MLMTTFFSSHHHFYIDASAWKNNYQLNKVQLVSLYILKYYELPIDGLLFNVCELQLILSWNGEYCWLVDWFSKLKSKRFFQNICK